MARNRYNKQDVEETTDWPNKFESFFGSLPNRGELSDIYKLLADRMDRNGLHGEHLCMQLLVSSHLLGMGCEEISVEHRFDKESNPLGLVIDVYGKSGSKSVGVEVETRDKSDFDIKVAARTIAKITRYSPMVTYFSLAVQPIYKPPVPAFFLNHSRESKELEIAKKITDTRYTSPRFMPGDFYDAKLSSLIIVDLNGGDVFNIRSGSKHISKRLNVITPDNYAELCYPDTSGKEAALGLSY
ncbi:MAG: hypothetical protein V1900_03705 [Candidatus Aenigmatarchaeota archaeon]